MVPSSDEVTQLLLAWNQGDHSALDKLTPLVYDELHRLAKHYMRHQSPGNILQTTALINEAYVRLIDASQVQWQNRAHFFGAAAEAMRRILVENARRKGRLKRGGDIEHQTLTDAALEVAGGAPNEEILAVHEALNRLASEDSSAAEVVKLRYFVGLPLPEVAEVLQVSPRTVDRLWAYARVRLKQVIRGEFS